MEKEKIKSTQGPWQTMRGLFEWIVYERLGDGCNGMPVCKIESKNAEANARFIVRACNSHYELLKAIKNFKTWYLTLGRMNPDAFIVLKEILPNELINVFAQVIVNTEREE